MWRMATVILGAIATVLATAAMVVAWGSVSSASEGNRGATERNEAIAPESDETPPPEFARTERLVHLSGDHQRLALFRIEQRPGDPVDLGTGPNGANPALARTVSTEHGKLAVVPGKGAICLYFVGGGGCGPVVETVETGLAIREYGADGLSRAFILVPDGVSEIAVEVDGKWIDQPVIRNVAAVGHARAERVRFFTPSGATVTKKL